MDPRITIAVNTRFLIKDRLEGIGYFMLETLRHIVHAHPEIDFYFLFDRECSPEFIFAKNIKPVVLFPPNWRPPLWFWWFEISVAKWLKKHKPDLFLSPDGFASLRAATPQVLVVHDLSSVLFPEQLPFIHRHYYRYFVPRFMRKAARIATVSEYSKHDIVQQYGITPEGIEVVYSASKKGFTTVGDEAKYTVKARYSSGRDYFLFVGALHPRKNVHRLFVAFDQFKQHTRSDYKLLIVGKKAWMTGAIDAAYQNMQFKEDVVFLGYLPEDELNQVTASARASIFVSLFEGFGVPIVEAMASGVPVITSNISSMPEIAGDAALLVDPYSVNDIASAMEKLSMDELLRKTLIERGTAQAAKFSWEETASKLWHTCARVLEETGTA